MKKEYLQNEIIKFTPLFNINFNIKKNLLCASFFKLKESYKDFNIYLDGLINIYYDVIKKYKDYYIRLFIDNSIYNDKEIMNKISKLDKLEIVLFTSLNNEYIGLFPTLIRFFPMFNFPNNDANIVIPIDIDDKNTGFIINEFKKIKNRIDILDKNIINNIYLIKIGNLSKNILYKYKSLYKNTINIYSIPQSIVNIIKINNSIIIDFFNKINKENKLYSYYKHFKYSKKESENKFIKTKPFIYGVDEYFINNTLTKYLINKKLLLINVIKWNITGNLYYLLSRNYLGLNKNQLNIIFNIFNILFKDLNLNINTKNKSLIEIFNIIDKLVYVDKNINIIKILYKIFLLNYKNKDYHFLFPPDLSKFLLSTEYKNVYEFNKIIFINSKYKEILINQQKI